MDDDLFEPSDEGSGDCLEDDCDHDGGDSISGASENSGEQNSELEQRDWEEEQYLEEIDRPLGLEAHKARVSSLRNTKKTDIKHVKRDDELLLDEDPVERHLPLGTLAIALKMEFVKSLLAHVSFFTDADCNDEIMDNVLLDEIDKIYIATKAFSNARASENPDREADAILRMMDFQRRTMLRELRWEKLGQKTNMEKQKGKAVDDKIRRFVSSSVVEYVDRSCAEDVEIAVFEVFGHIIPRWVIEKFLDSTTAFGKIIDNLQERNEWLGKPADDRGKEPPRGLYHMPDDHLCRDTIDHTEWSEMYDKEAFAAVREEVFRAMVEHSDLGYFWELIHSVECPMTRALFVRAVVYNFPVGQMQTHDVSENVEHDDENEIENEAQFEQDALEAGKIQEELLANKDSDIFTAKFLPLKKSEYTESEMGKFSSVCELLLNMFEFPPEYRKIFFYRGLTKLSKWVGKPVAFAQKMSEWKGKHLGKIDISIVDKENPTDPRPQNELILNSGRCRDVLSFLFTSFLKTMVSKLKSNGRKQSVPICGQAYIVPGKIHVNGGDDEICEAPNLHVRVSACGKTCVSEAVFPPCESGTTDKFWEKERLVFWPAGVSGYIERRVGDFYYVILLESDEKLRLLASIEGLDVGNITNIQSGLWKFTTNSRIRVCTDGNVINFNRCLFCGEIAFENRCNCKSFGNKCPSFFLTYENGESVEVRIKEGQILHVNPERSGNKDSNEMYVHRIKGEYLHLRHLHKSKTFAGSDGHDCEGKSLVLHYLSNNIEIPLWGTGHAHSLSIKTYQKTEKYAKGRVVRSMFTEAISKVVELSCYMCDTSFKHEFACNWCGQVEVLKELIVQKPSVAEGDALTPAVVDYISKVYKFDRLVKSYFREYECERVFKFRNDDEMYREFDAAVRKYDEILSSMDEYFGDVSVKRGDYEISLVRNAGHFDFFQLFDDLAKITEEMKFAVDMMRQEICEILLWGIEDPDLNDLVVEAKKKVLNHKTKDERGVIENQLSHIRRLALGRKKLRKKYIEQTLHDRCYPYANLPKKADPLYDVFSNGIVKWGFEKYIEDFLTVNLLGEDHRMKLTIYMTWHYPQCSCSTAPDAVCPMFDSSKKSAPLNSADGCAPLSSGFGFYNRPNCVPTNSLCNGPWMGVDGKLRKRLEMILRKCEEGFHVMREETMSAAILEELASMHGEDFLHGLIIDPSAPYNLVHLFHYFFLMFVWYSSLPSKGWKLEVQQFAKGEKGNAVRLPWYMRDPGSGDEDKALKIIQETEGPILADRQPWRSQHWLERFENAEYEKFFDYWKENYKSTSPAAKKSKIVDLEQNTKEILAAVRKLVIASLPYSSCAHATTIKRHKTKCVVSGAERIRRSWTKSLSLVSPTKSIEEAFESLNCKATPEQFLVDVWSGFEEMSNFKKCCRSHEKFLKILKQYADDQSLPSSLCGSSSCDQCKSVCLLRDAKKGNYHPGMKLLKMWIPNAEEQLEALNKIGDWMICDCGRELSKCHTHFEMLPPCAKDKNCVQKKVDGVQVCACAPMQMTTLRFGDGSWSNWAEDNRSCKELRHAEAKTLFDTNACMRMGFFTPGAKPDTGEDALVHVPERRRPISE